MDEVLSSKSTRTPPARQAPLPTRSLKNSRKRADTTSKTTECSETSSALPEPYAIPYLPRLRYPSPSYPSAFRSFTGRAPEISNTFILSDRHIYVTRTLANDFLVCLLNTTLPHLPSTYIYTAKVVFSTARFDTRLLPSSTALQSLFDTFSCPLQSDCHHIQIVADSFTFINIMLIPSETRPTLNLHSRPICRLPRYLQTVLHSSIASCSLQRNACYLVSLYAQHLTHTWYVIQ